MRHHKKLWVLMALLLCSFAAHAQNDWTGKLKNASFESGTSGWTLEKKVSGYEDIAVKSSDAAAGLKQYNIWAAQVTSLNLYQTLSLPAGSYELSACLFTDKEGLNDQHLYVKAGNNTFSSEVLETIDSWHQLSVSFQLTEETNVTMGVASTGDGTSPKGWFRIDDVRLSSDQTTTFDWTSAINNASFENGSSGWVVSKEVSGWEDIAVKSGSSADGNQHYNVWAEKVNRLTLAQDIVLPAGHYELTCMLITDTQGLNDQHAFVNISGQTLDSDVLTEADVWKPMSVTFALEKETRITIGATGSGDGTDEKGWFRADAFHLNGDAVPHDDVSAWVEKVSGNITLSGQDVLHVWGTEPFTETGRIAIEGTEDACIYFDNMPPTEVQKWLAYITILGKEALSERTCQLRAYDHGTVLLPYGKENKNANGFHPLTVYSEQYCVGESCDRFGIENTNGFMNSLTEETLNNRIRSFRLKKGYMVTFSIQKEGYGYQRCFIADQEDLVVNTLPSILDGRISSYRIFRFNNIGKNGVANILDNSKLTKLHATWTYAWGAGNSLGLDHECVPHLNNLWSTTNEELGKNNQSPYLKTDNEPANSHDPYPASVAQELQRWPDLMRTGRRLISPSSFDSGGWWHKQFLDSIDARGWRCDVVDIHTYWSEGSYDNIWSNWYQKFKRPIWITEMLWGASWSGGFGIFGVATTDEERRNPSASTLNKNKEVLSRIFNKLNGWDFIERYAYWNNEWDCSKIMRGDELTPAGEYFAQMKTGVSYKGSYWDYVPKDWRLHASTDVKATYDKETGNCTVEWCCYNGDLSETLTLQRRKGAGEWEDVKNWIRPDDYKMSYTEPLPDGETYTYRVVEVSYKNKTMISESVTLNSGVDARYYEPGLDMTSRIANANFEGGKKWTNNSYDIPTSWSVDLDATGTSEFYVTDDGGWDNGKYYKLWSTNITKAELSQQITLPEGYYTLQVKVKAGKAHSNQLIYVRVKGVARITNSRPQKEDEWEDVIISFRVPKETTVTIGARVEGDGTNGEGWMYIDDFTLTYDAPTIATVKHICEDVESQYSFASPEKLQELQSRFAEDETMNGFEALYALRNVVLGHASAEGVKGTEDVTNLLGVSDFSGSLSWKNEYVEGFTNQKDGICLAGEQDKDFISTNTNFWWSSSATMSYTTEIANLPAGTYQLSVIVRGNLQPNLRLIANDKESDLIPAYGSYEGTGIFNYGWQCFPFIFENEREQNVTLGLKANALNSHSWVNFDRFRLVRFGEHAPTGITSTTSETEGASYYDLEGRFLGQKLPAGLHHQIVIAKKPDGSRRLISIK